MTRKTCNYDRYSRATCWCYLVIPEDDDFHRQIARFKPNYPKNLLNWKSKLAKSIQVSSVQCPPTPFVPASCLPLHVLPPCDGWLRRAAGGCAFQRAWVRLCVRACVGAATVLHARLSTQTLSALKRARTRTRTRHAHSPRGTSVHMHARVHALAHGALTDTCAFSHTSKIGTTCGHALGARARTRAHAHIHARTSSAKQRC